MSCQVYKDKDKVQPQGRQHSKATPYTDLSFLLLTKHCITPSGESTFQGFIHIRIDATMQLHHYMAILKDRLHCIGGERLYHLHILLTQLVSLGYLLRIGNI